MSACDATGVVLVYDPTIKEQEKDIELWYKSYVNRLHLKDAQVLVFAHTASSGGRSTYQAPRSLDKFKFLNTTLDSEDTANKMPGARRPQVGGDLHPLPPLHPAPRLVS